MSFTLSRTAPLRAGLASVPTLRALALPALRRLDRPIKIRHAYTGDPLDLLSYTHKGYWYYGRSREAATMQRIANLVRPGDTVIEAGGHIGYVSQYLAKVVGDRGRVHVFEPGSKNSEFLSRNLSHLPQTLHIKAALSDHAGIQTFYEENIGGFMNSLDPSFVRDSQQGRRRVHELNITKHNINTLRLDDYATRHNVTPQFLKIDVEGSERAVLFGAEKTLARTPALMVEVSRDQAEIFELLGGLEFRLSDELGAPVTAPDQMHGNIFAEKQRRPSDAVPR